MSYLRKSLPSANVCCAAVPLSVIFLILTASATVSDSCHLFSADDIYSLDTLPYDCNADAFDPCATTFCTCNNMIYSSTELKCLLNGTNQANSNCTVLSQCLADYSTCVNNGYVSTLDVITSNCLNSSSVSFFQAQAVTILAGAQQYNDSDLFQACAYMVCNIGNISSCSVDSGSLLVDQICTAPEGITAPITSAPGSTPAPTNSDGTFKGDVKLVRLIVTFLADFESLMTGDGPQKIKNTTSKIFTDKLHYPTTVKSFKYTASGGKIFSYHRMAESLAAGSLVLVAEAQILASDNATLNAFLKNIVGMQSDQSPNWFAALAVLCGCQVPLPNVTYSIFLVPATQPSVPTTEDVCSPRCIAGAIVGGVCGVILITIIVIIFTKRAERQRQVGAAQDFELAEQETHQPDDAPNHMKV